MDSVGMSDHRGCGSSFVHLVVDTLICNDRMVIHLNFGVSAHQKMGQTPLKMDCIHHPTHLRIHHLGNHNHPGNRNSVCKSNDHGCSLLRHQDHCSCNSSCSSYGHWSTSMTSPPAWRIFAQRLHFLQCLSNYIQHAWLCLRQMIHHPQCATYRSYGTGRLSVPVLLSSAHC